MEQPSRWPGQANVPAAALRAAALESGRVNVRDRLLTGDATTGADKLQRPTLVGTERAERVQAACTAAHNPTTSCCVSWSR